MKNAFIINAHQPYPGVSEGRLNASLVERMTGRLRDKGYEVRATDMSRDHKVEDEIENHLWADAVILQTPVNWMGVPWTFKKYMDEVYSGGLMGVLCDGDGRTSKAPTKNYGTGGKLADKKYMLSLTFNAPREAFDDENEWFFAGKGVDDLFWPMHLNFKFFAMRPLETFVCYDVMKNPDVEGDFKRLDAHIDANF